MHHHIISYLEIAMVIFLHCWVPDRRAGTWVANLSFGFRGCVMFAQDRTFDPATLRIVQTVFEEAAAALPPDLQTQERKTILASRILHLAWSGETDPVRLRTAALLHFVPWNTSKNR
jgi:hypothetical protein